MRIEYIEQAEDLSSIVANDIIGLSKQKEGTLHIALAGGRSAQYIVQGLLSVEPAIQKRVQLHLVDERLEGETNRDTLIDAGLPEIFTLKQLSIPCPGLELPRSLFDRVYLGVGEDGHIASLFPHAWPETTTTQVAVIEQSPKPPSRRVTYTYYGFSLLADCAHVFLLFLGEAKRAALRRLAGGKEDAHTLPCAFFADKQFTTVIITDLKE